MNDEMKIVVRCPHCHNRVIDKVGKGNVDVFMKCPHCKQQIKIDLSFRLNRSSGLRYRMAF